MMTPPFFLYLLSVFIFFSSSHLLMFWLFMEINLICFIIFSYSEQNEFCQQEFFNSLFFYFLVQSIGSLMFLFFVLNKDFYSMMDFFFFISLSVKLAIFPFFFWMFRISSGSSKMTLGLLLTIQKFPLLLILYSSNLVYFFLLLSLISGTFLLIFSNSISFLLISSSIVSSYWMLFIFMSSFSLFFTFYFIYSVTVFFLLGFLLKWDSLNYNHVGIVSLLFLAGMPPLSLFFFKYILTLFLSGASNTLEFLMFFIFSFLSLVGYSKYFYLGFSSSISFFKTNKFFNKQIFYIYIVFSFFFTFFFS